MEIEKEKKEKNQRTWL